MKKQVRKKPTGGGLPAVNEKNLVHKTGLTVDLILKSYLVRQRIHDEDYSDQITVTYLKRLIDVDGDIVQEKEMSYTIDDVGALVEYELFADTIFNQVDIDNPAYTVDYAADEITVTGIHWIDGQIEEEDPDTGEMVMVDNVINIEPLHRKGQIDYSTEVVITAEKIPLKGYTTAYGNGIGQAAINNIKNRNGY